MRIRIIHIMIAAAVILSSVSCRKETSMEHKDGLAGTFTANIDGVGWIAADSTKGASILLGMINISGISMDNKQLSITLNDTMPGVYKLSQVSASLAAYADSSNSYAFTTNQGNDTSQAGGLVTVTEIDRVNKTLSGTFAFKVYRDIDKHQKTITEGVFYKLPYVTTLPPASGLDSMRAVIDGTSWKAQSIVATALAPQLAITGSALNGSQSIGLLIPLTITPGAYALDYTGLTYIAIYNPTATISLLSSSGTLEILENSTSGRIRGNFQFQASNPLNPAVQNQITSGYFSVKYN
ncbi:MAG TPA: DUF6252 family protein [Puia sp.]